MKAASFKTRDMFEQSRRSEDPDKSFLMKIFKILEINFQSKIF